MIEFSTYSRANRHSLYRSDLVDRFDDGMFDPEYWTSRDLVTATAVGRGEVLFVESGDEGWVVRPYRRGGLIGRLIRRSYFYTGCDRSRSFRELRLLAAMQARDLPVPRPVAALCERHGLFYRACIITETIPHQTTLWQMIHAQLSDEPDERQNDQQMLGTITAVGRCIRRFHDAGVWHADLNAHNVLISDDDHISLIDFDRGRMSETAERDASEASSNLERLKRSVNKCLNNLPETTSGPTLLGLHAPEEHLSVIESAFRDGYEP